MVQQVSVVRRRFGKVMLVCFLAALGLLSSGIYSAHAAVASVTPSGLVGSLTTVFGGGVNDFMALFYAVVPKLLLIFVAILMLRFGTKLFRKWAGHGA